MTRSADHIDDGLLSALVDDQLTSDEALQVRAHLETCPECQAQLAGFRSVRDLLRQLPEVPLTRDFALGPRLLVDPPNVIRMRRWFVAARTAAAALAAIWIGLSAGALYIDFRPAQSGAALVAVQPQVASAPAPAAQNAPAPAAQSAPAVATPPARLAVPAAAAAKPAPASLAGAAAAGAQADDQVAAATSVSPLPTPAPPAQPTAVPPPLPIAPTVGAADPAAPLRTAAFAVGGLTLLALLATLLMWRRVKQTATHF